MDPNNIITILTGIAGVTGGLIGGRKLGNQQATTTAVSTVSLLQVAVEELRIQNVTKDEQIAELTGRVGVLEGLVTQRAEVAQVKEVVDRIATKVGA